MTCSLQFCVQFISNSKQKNLPLFILHNQSTFDVAIYASRFLARHSALLGYGKAWWGQCQENVTEWDIRS